MIKSITMIAAFMLLASSWLSALTCGYTMSMMTVSTKTCSSKKSLATSTMGRKAFIGTIAISTAAIVQNKEAQAAVPPSGKGVKAPNFELPSSRGDLISLETFTKSGKWTVLYFYPAAFTSGCTLEAQSFKRDSDKYSQLNTQIVGVSVDSVEKNAQFCQEEELNYYMLSDAGGKVSKLYGTALSIPGFGTFSNRQTYLIDPQGALRWVFTDVESHVSRHSAEVLAKLEEVQKEDSSEA